MTVGLGTLSLSTTGMGKKTAYHVLGAKTKTKIKRRCLETKMSHEQGITLISTDTHFCASSVTDKNRYISKHMTLHKRILYCQLTSLIRTDTHSSAHSVTDQNRYFRIHMALH